MEDITSYLLLALGHAAEMEVVKRNNKSKGCARKCHEAWNKAL
jgi:hypothetical protein